MDSFGFDELCCEVSDEVASVKDLSSSSRTRISGTLQSRALIMDGRPVIIVSILSKDAMVYHVRACASFSAAVSEGVTFKRCIPMDCAERIARPVRFQDLRSFN